MDAPRARLGGKRGEKPGDGEGKVGDVWERRGRLSCLSQHRHAAVPRNPSSERGSASLSPWL